MNRSATLSILGICALLVTVVPAGADTERPYADPPVVPATCLYDFQESVVGEVFVDLDVGGACRIAVEPGSTVRVDVEDELFDPRDFTWRAHSVSEGFDFIPCNTPEGGPLASGSTISLGSDCTKMSIFVQQGTVGTVTVTQV